MRSAALAVSLLLDMAILSQAKPLPIEDWKVQRPDGSYPNAMGEGKGRVQFSKPDVYYAKALHRAAAKAAGG